MGAAIRATSTLLDYVARSMHGRVARLLHNRTRPCTAHNIILHVRGQKVPPNQGVDTSFFNKSQYIANTKAGIAQQYRVTTNRTAKDATRLPVTADMIITYHKGAVHREPTLLQRALLAAQLTGFFTMVARVSEYLYTTRSNYWLATEYV